MPMKPLDLTSGTKRCPACEQTKPLDEFYKSKSTGHGYQVYCKACTYARHLQWRKKNLDYTREASKKWRQDNPRAAKDHTLRSRYGVPLGTYEKMFAEQEGKCAICETTDPRGRGDFHIDHCHETGVVRGLLCHYCNIAIGSLFHREELLLKAVDYLRRSAEGRTKC